MGCYPIQLTKPPARVCVQTPMAGPILGTIVKANVTGPNMTLLVGNLTNMTDPLGLVKNVTQEIFDIAEAFEMKLMETPMYKEAYEKYKSPLNISDMSDGLRELVCKPYVANTIRYRIMLILTTILAL